MSFEILNTPIFATIQDKGRFSYTSIGVTNSGVMDEFSYEMANRLLGNEDKSNTIEVAFSNVHFKVNSNTTLAITGALCEFFINDILKTTWQTYNVKAGDIIKVGKILEGVRVYISVKDGFKIKKEFGSNSTTIKENLGGLDGDKLKKGQVLPFNSYSQSHNTRLKKEFIPKFTNELELRVLLSYQDDSFQKVQIDKFFSSTYTITNEFNRMACKLRGEAISCDINGIISEGISFGAIQIPSNGQPIILLKDRQTIGGYPKIGSVLSIDCFKLSQCKPGCKIRFKPIEIVQAQKKLKEFYLSFN